MNNRYSIINGEFRREIILLKGRDCSYGKCHFCNYTLDNSIDTDLNFKLNKQVINKVVGVNGILEVINSGNVFDLDDRTLSAIKDVVIEKQIKILYFESYLNEIQNLAKIRSYFHMCEIRFRIGIETFNDEFRAYLGKPFKYKKHIDKVKDQYYSACIMTGIKGQSIDDLRLDIELGLQHFSQITLNVFVDNGTKIKADSELKKQFIQQVYPSIKDNKRIEILIDNKDLGVFEQ